MRSLNRFLVLSLALMTSAFALEYQKYDPQEEARVLSAKTAIVHVNAPWCPVCKRQRNIIEEKIKPLAEGPDFILVNYDTDSSFLKKHNVQSQATVILFSEGKEVERVSGVTDKDQLHAFIDRARALRKK